MPLRVLAICGSLRARSSNGELLRAAARLAPAEFAVDLYDGLDTLPHFNPDLDREDSVVPAPVALLRARLGAAEALLISSPEYAHGVPGALKNALDWLVSGSEMPGTPAGVLTASATSVYAHASLVETLRTMSANVVAGAVRVVPLGGRRLSAAEIVADASLAGIVRDALDALRHTARSAP